MHLLRLSYIAAPRVLTGLPAALALLTVTLAPALHSAQAQTSPASPHTVFITARTVIKTFVRGAVSVGYAGASDLSRKNNPVSPDVVLLQGASVPDGIGAFNRSAVRISGGKVDGGLEAHDSSRIEISGGSINVLEARGRSQVFIRGGAIDAELSAHDSSQVVIAGGVTGNIFIYDHSVMTVRSGCLQESLSAGGHSVMNIRGGDIRGSLDLGDSSTLNMVGKNLRAAARQGPHDSGAYRFYTLTGTLADGSSLHQTLSVTRSSKAKVTFNGVPAALD